MEMDRFILPIFFLLCLPALTTTTSATASLQDIHALRNFLFTNKTYDIQIRPIFNQSRCLYLNMSLTLISISSLSVTSGRIELHGYVTVTWRDEILQWNPGDYGGVDHLDLTVEDIWVPHLQQTLVGIDDKMFETTSVLKLHSDGSVKSMTYGVLRGTCDQQMQYYPFDKQSCMVDIVSASSDNTEIKFLSTRSNVPMLNIDNGQWDWVEGRAEVLQYVAPGAHRFFFDVLRIHAVCRRKPDFLVIHIGLPYSMLLLLNLFVFLTPLQSGERISFAVTLLLAFVFYSTYISGEIPENSTSISIVSLYTAITLAMCTFTVAISIVLCRLLEPTEKQVPRWLRILARRIVKVNNENNSEFITKGETDAVTFDDKGVLHDEANEISIHYSAVHGNDNNGSREIITWSMAANALDRVSLIMLSFILIVTWIAAIPLYHY